MKYKIEFSRKACSFARERNIVEIIEDKWVDVMRLRRGATASVDIKKLKGKWKGYLRPRMGECRVIFQILDNIPVYFIEKIDISENVY